MNSPEVFYLHLSGEQRGPYTIPQIDHLLNSGLIAEETLYWREGLEQWEPVTSLVRLRRKTKPWRKIFVTLAVLLALGLVGWFFGSVAVIGWREANQNEYSEAAAYWRARGLARATLPRGTLLEFQPLAATAVELQPPDGASVRLHGSVIDLQGQAHPQTWQVPLRFDAQTREWSGAANAMAP